MESKYPTVTFFVESREESERTVISRQGSEKSSRGRQTRGEFLQEHIGNNAVIGALKEIRGRIAVALNCHELASDAALIQLLKEFNAMNVPVDVWANLTDGEGYWIHAGNMQAVRKCVEKIAGCLEQKGVQFQNIGLDLEFPASILMGGFRMREYCSIKPWSFPHKQAQKDLRDLIEEILMRTNYGVHTYEIPLLGDSPLARKMLGIPRAPEKEEVLLGRSGKYKRVAMVYSSGKPPVFSSDGFIKKYSGGYGRVPALGVISGTDSNPGRDIAGVTKLLSQPELERDVASALGVSPDEFFVFALNGLPVVERTREAVSTIRV